MSKPLAPDLQQLFDKGCPKTEGALPITIKVNHLFVYEPILGGKVTVVELNLSFIAHNDNNQYVELFRASVAQEANSFDGLDDERNVLNAVENCVQQYQQRNRANKLNNTPLSQKQLTQNALETTNYKCLSDSVYSAGLYYTFADFRDNLPTNEQNYTINYRTDFKDNSTFAFLEAKNGNKKMLNVWGFSDGKRVFINLGDRYVPMTKENNNFVFANSVANPNNNNVIMAGVLFGLVGSLVASAIENEKTINVPSKLDFATGTPLLLNTNKSKQVETMFMLYCSKYNQIDKGFEGAFELYLDGVKQCSLQPGTYFVAKVGFKNKASRLCLKYNDKEICQDLEPNPFEAMTYLCRSVKNNKLVIDKLNVQMKKSVAADIKDGKIKKVCE